MRGLQFLTGWGEYGAGREVGRALVEATHELKQHPGPVRDQFTKLLRAEGRSKATIAAARKLCCYVYWMLRDQRSYPEWLQARQHPALEVRPS